MKIKDLCNLIMCDEDEKLFVAFCGWLRVETNRTFYTIYTKSTKS